MKLSNETLENATFCSMNFSTNQDLMMIMITIIISNISADSLYIEIRIKSISSLERWSPTLILFRPTIQNLNSFSSLTISK